VVVVVATPWDSAVATVRALRELVTKGKVVISMVNALAREGKELVPLYPARGSMAAQLAFALPESIIVGAFHHLPASEMEDLDSGLDADVVIFSDSAAGRSDCRGDRERDARTARGGSGIDVARQCHRSLYRGVHLDQHSPQGAQLRETGGTARLMQLYDSARRGVFPLEVGPVASLYSCGITPYDSAHLGHAFVYLWPSTCSASSDRRGSRGALRAQRHRRRRRHLAQRRANSASTTSTSRPKRWSFSSAT
jgi:hypothetical protein